MFLFILQIRAIPMNRSSAQEVISAYLFNIYATELQIVWTDTTRMPDSALLVRFGIISREVSII